MSVDGWGHVRQVPALLRQSDSKATYSQLRTALREHADKPPALKGKVLYGGRLNVRLALDALG